MLKVVLDTKDQSIENVISAPHGSQYLLEEKINIVQVNWSGHREAMGTQRRNTMHEKSGKAHKK